MIERGLKGVRLVVGDRCAGLVATVGEMLPQARYQRCMVHFMRNVLSKVPPTHREWASAAPEAIFAMESRASALGAFFPMLRLEEDRTEVFQPSLRIPYEWLNRNAHHARGARLRLLRLREVA